MPARCSWLPPVLRRDLRCRIGRARHLHHRTLYYLRQTRYGKLILTK